jgi:hypothetical protein
MPGSSFPDSRRISIAPWVNNMPETTVLGTDSRQGPDRARSSPEAGKSIDELIAATGGGANAAFDFQHKVFALPGARFAVDRRARATMFYMHLGNLSVSLTPTVLRREFHIETASHDSNLIELAGKALRYVKEVRPGDSIPKELIDGSASWTVEERHRRLAKAKLLALLSAWPAQDKKGAPVEAMLAIADDTLTTKEEFQSAFAALARALALDGNGKQEIVDHIDDIAREICYIEALRDHAHQLRDIRERVLQLTCAAKGNAALIEELTRILALLKQPMADFSVRFERIDAQTSDLLALLGSPWIHIKRIRDARDDIHANLLPWSDTFERWRDQEVVFNHDTRENIRDLHRWLAANYAPALVWQ